MDGVAHETNAVQRFLLTKRKGRYRMNMVKRFTNLSKNYFVSHFITSILCDFYKNWEKMVKRLNR